MLRNVMLDSLLFFDIETVPEVPAFNDLDEEMQDLFDIKTAYQRRDGQTAAEFYERAGIWAEFGKVVCISVGYFTYKNGDRQFRVKSFAGEECRLLQEFSNLIDEYFNDPTRVLCGHNIKEFDIPFVVRRMLINEVKIPNKLCIIGKKPWEVNHLDTMEMWKIGDYKHFTSLRLLTRILGIPSPKDDIDGSEVAKVYYEDKDIDRIIVYCEKDVVAVAQVLLRFKREELLSQSEIFSV
ncbi:3'-5' exonuclease [Myroides odoratimimus]|uniref:3'-5' exonuclease n=1 Tax=Myroides odoratimimus TaxID=76832 RepID=UPI002DB7BB33|nr:3'-5' exonuclease [Myroides odoratimimus]MEC4083789.1 3'-5' exonuclease [Myroides odoratimimus]